MENTRTKKALLNAVTGSAMQILNVVLGFVSRTIFIYLLNSDYLGVNSLYTNILTVLSFAELGIGSAIVFSLYQPIAEKDKAKIQALMKLYKKAYWTIGVVIFVLGLCVIPFLKYYLVQIYTRVFQLIQIVLQSIFLLITHEYLIYLIIFIVCTIGQNVFLSLKADHLYPYIKEKNENTLSADETKSIFDNVKALFVYKFGSVILNGTDNIIISSVINVSAVGIASNYTMLMTNVTNIIGCAINSMTASVGNLSVNGSKQQIRSVLHQLLMLCVWLYGFIAIGFFALANDFVYLWIGDKYVLDQMVVFSILFSLYINGIQYSAYTFRTTQGLFVQSKWIPMLSAIINIILSIWWGNVIGLAGIFIATGISRLVTTTVVDPWLVYKHNFDEKPLVYYFKLLWESVAVLVNGVIQYNLIRLIHLDGWSGFVIKFVALSIMTNNVFVIEFGWTEYFKGLVHRILPKFSKKKKEV